MTRQQHEHIQQREGLNGSPNFIRGQRFGYNLEIAKRGRVLGTGVELIKVTNMVINRYSGVLFLLK